MAKRTVRIGGVVALLILIGTVPGRAQEEAVTPDKIPPAVMNALRSKFQNPVIDRCTRAREGGHVVYDIEFRSNGRKHEADITENGGYINYEKAIEARDLPDAVRSALERRYPNAKLGDVMEETEVKGTSEKVSAYEVMLTTGDGRSVEVRLSTGGRILEDTGRNDRR